MDNSDPQTLGFMVFGGFMIISAVGIALISTLSMKETSYEEALAKQRRQLIQTQTQKPEKKKKDKTLEKKNKAKKKEDQPDGKLSDPGSDGGEEPEVVTCTEPESDPEPAGEPSGTQELKPTPELEPEPTGVTATIFLSAPAPSPKEKKKKQKSVRVEPAAVVDTITKEVLVMSLAPVVDVSPVNVVPEVTKEASPAKSEEPKESMSKKKKPKNKPEPVTDSSLQPYGEMLSTVTNAMLSDDQVHKLMDVLNQKAGVHQDSWQLACQRGDPVSALRKQLEEKEKLMTTGQEEATTARNRLRELSKELSAEKSKMASLEARLKADLNAQVQEVKTLQTRMQTADQEHLKHMEQLTQKIGSLQEQLENGPTAQLTRLQQENSILRDALNQATSQAESRVKEDEAAAGDQTQKDGSGSETESDQPFESLEEDSQLLRLEEDVLQLRKELQQARNHGDELQEKMAASAAAFSTAERLSEERELQAQSRFDALSSDLQASLQLLFPDVSVEAEQEDWFQPFVQKVQERETELQLRLNAAEKKQAELQTEIDQKSKLLQETEAELHALRRRTEEEEDECRKKLSEAERQKQTVWDQLKLLEVEVESWRTETGSCQQLKEQLMLLEAQLEKQLEEASMTQSCSEELAQVQSQLQQVSVRLQVEQQRRQRVEAELQQARQEVVQLQQKVEADQRSAAALKVSPPTFVQTRLEKDEAHQS